MVQLTTGKITGTLRGLLFFWPLFLIPLLIALPNVLLGVHGGDDFAFHIPTWLDAASQQRTFPEWAASVNFGFGDARFQFYPPISWALGGLLCRFLSPPAALACYIFVCAVVAGFSMYMLARPYLTRVESLIAGAFCPLSPYFLYDLYHRAAYAEALAAAILPGSIALLLRVQRTGRLRDIALFAASYSLIWLTNIPLAIISSISFLTLSVVLSLTYRDRKFLFAAALGALLACGLIAFYFMPAIAQFDWVDSTWIGNGVRNWIDFTYGVTLPLVGSAVIQIVGSLVAIRMFRSPGLRLPLLVLGILPLILLLPPSLPVWSLPGMRLIQFPYRWLTVLIIPYCLTVGRLLAAWPRTLAAGALLSLLLLLSAPAVVKRRTAGVTYMESVREAVERGSGYQLLGEYIPRQFRFQTAKEQLSPISFVDDGGDATARPVSWAASHRTFEVLSSRQTVVRLRIAYYPAWRVVANGLPIPATFDVNGVLLAAVPAGRSEVEVYFDSPPGRSLGFTISLLSAFFVLYAVIRRRRDDDCSTVAPS